MSNSSRAEVGLSFPAYRFRLRPLAAWATPWRADTLAGSLCWAWRDIAGERELDALLEEFLSGQPRFVLSDAFPADLLPFPVGARAQVREGEKIKAAWCRSADFKKWVGETGTDLPVACRVHAPLERVGLLHAQRNRKTDSTQGGELFEMEQYAFNPGVLPGPEQQVFSVYIRADEGTLHTLERCWEILGASGFGARNSTGLGAFELVSGPARCEWLDIKGEHSGFVSLSHFLPAKDDPRDGLWRLHVTHPKFASDRVPQFLKGNLLMLTPGSRFRTGSAPKPFYGRALPMRRDGFPNALQYGFAFVAPMRWRDE